MDAVRGIFVVFGGQVLRIEEEVRQDGIYWGEVAGNLRYNSMV